MTAKVLVGKLFECGYRFSLSGDNIVLKYTGRDDPNSDEILPLVSELKQHKLEIIQYLKDERFLNTFRDTVNEMTDKYKDMLFDYSRNRIPEKYEQFNQTENRINKFWDEDNFESFQKELDNWRGIYFELLKLFEVKND